MPADERASVTDSQPPNHQELIASLLTNGGLHGLFQPMLDVANGVVFAHEGLIRGPEGGPLHTPAALFTAAAAARLMDRLEIEAARVIFDGFARQSGAGLLFVNFSARAVTQLGSARGRETFHDMLNRCSLPARSLVIEITEHERVDDHDALAEAIEFLHGSGAAIALDDFGDGRSSLRLWAELQPEYVKIDRYFCHGIHADGKKVQSVEAILGLAENFGSRVIAEGIEEAADLRVARDLGVQYVQGYVIGRPRREPTVQVPVAAESVLAGSGIAVFPQVRRASPFSPKAGQLLIPAPPVSVSCDNQRLLEQFQRHPQLHAIAIVKDNTPVGLVNRRHFTEKYMLPYYPEIYGRKSCTAFMDPDPLLIEVSRPIEDLVHVLTSDDQRYLSNGYVLVDAGAYVGLGTAERLVRSVTERRIEAARHANPLTFLPGNIPISEHIRRLLAGGGPFAATYCDLNHFKPFNDRFGYWHGDKMIRLLASVIVSECDPHRDFAGHVGGDDFVVLFQSTDWRSRCERIIRRFDAAALTLFDPESRARGYLEAEDRAGNPACFPLTTLSIGAVEVMAGAYDTPEEVASAAAAAKHQAKRHAKGLWATGEGVAPVEAPSRQPDRLSIVA